MSRKRIARWVDDRLGLTALKSALLNKSIPASVGWWHTVGSLCGFLFLLQVATGLLLACSYVPSPDSAWQTTQCIQHQLTLGWLIRGIHHWASSFMVLAVLVHLFRVFFHGAYKAPHELTWMSGVTLLALTFGMAFTGYLLPWTNQSYWATTIALFLSNSVPLVGPSLVTLLGGTEVGGSTLIRFYAFHVLFIPAAMTAFMTLHILLLQRHGAAGPPPRREDEEVSTQPFFPTQVIRDLIMWALALILLLTAVHYAGVPPAKAADPLDLSATPRPEWYFLFYYEILKLFPGRWMLIAVAVLPLVGFLLVLLLPFYDRTTRRCYRNRPVALGVGVAMAVLLLYLTMVGAFSSADPQKFFGPDRRLTVKELAGLALFAQNNCYSCHSIKGVGMKHAPDLWRAGEKRERAWLENLLKDPNKTIGKKAKMVKYHLSTEDLDALVTYLQGLDLHRNQSRHVAPELFLGASAFYHSHCLSCHRIGQEGKGEDLVNATRKKTDAALRRYLTDDENHRFVVQRTLPPETVAQISAFLRALPQEETTEKGVP
jgi:ubiquinol-cytochrome c reductase cytochrome b subunit